MGPPRAPRTERGLLLALVALLAGLLAVPASVRDPAPRGAVEGRLCGAPHAALADVPVLLFADGVAEPVELTRTDGRGRFAFRAAPARFRVLALPARASGLAAAWRVDLRGGLDGFVELAPARARPAGIAVLDADGRPVPGAEVAAFSLGPWGALATDLARTDAQGRAALVLPPRAGIAARSGARTAFGPAPEGATAVLVLPGVR